MADLPRDQHRCGTRLSHACRWPGAACVSYDCLVNRSTAPCPALAAGASVASFLVEPRSTVSLGASGAVFGLFAVAVLLKLRFNFGKLVECLVLGQFVVKQVLQVRHPPCGWVQPLSSITPCHACMRPRKWSSLSCVLCQA